MQDNSQLLYFKLTQTILECSFDVINEPGSGFLERGQKIGLYIADLIVEENVIVELKCCESVLGEHQAQLINYLKVSDISVGLLVNFGKRKVEYKRLHNPDYLAACDHAYPVIFLFSILFFLCVLALNLFSLCLCVSL